MAECKETSRRLGSLAARVLRDDTVPEHLKALAGSVLGQRPSRPKHRRSKARPSHRGDEQSADNAQYCGTLAVPTRAVLSITDLHAAGQQS